MTNDTKDILMQYLYRFADHYGINSEPAVSFRKRAELIDKLKEKDKQAWVVIDELFTAFIKEDRIQNDKEKYDKARTLWDSEHAAAEHEKVEAERRLIEFCKAQHIKVGKLSVQL